MENQVTVTKSQELMALEAKQAAEFAITPVGMMVRNMEAISQVAQYYAKSDFVPKTYQGKPENCIIAIDMAMRMNMNPIMVMQNMYIVNGTPKPSSQLIIAMINNCGRFEPLKFETNGKGGDDFGMRAWTYRKDDHENKLEGSWVTQKVVKASHWGSKWQEIPEQMYMYRSAVFWARIHAPEITMGFYTKDETEEPSFEAEIIHDAAPKSPQQIAMEEMKAKKARRATQEPVKPVETVIYPEAEAHVQAQDANPQAEKPNTPIPTPFDEPGETGTNLANSPKAERTLL